jgi:hypothetical protein
VALFVESPAADIVRTRSMRMIADMPPQMSQVDAGAMVFLLEWAASDCIKAAANCRRPGTGKLLRALAEDVARERDKYYRLVVADQPNWARPIAATNASSPKPALTGVGATSRPAQAPRRSALIQRAMERMRAIGASGKLSPIPARVSARR